MLRLERAPGDRWTVKDRLLALALQGYEDDLCECGHPRSESMDPDNEGRYSAPPPSRCHACTAIERRSEQYKEAKAPRALRFAAILTKRKKD